MSFELDSYLFPPFPIMHTNNMRSRILVQRNLRNFDNSDRHWNELSLCGYNHLSPNYSNLNTISE